MIAEVEKLFNRVASLPENIQSDLALFWNEDIESETYFDKKIYETTDKLELLAHEALTDYRLGKTIEKGIDEL